MPGMPIRTILLSIAALACFEESYRFASLGITLQDNRCVGFAGVAVSVAIILLWFAFRKKPSKGG
jgi:hypothetical protein